MIIGLVEIPHQGKARLHWYWDRDALTNDALDYAMETDRPEPETFADAVATLTNDWQGHILVETAGDVVAVERYRGHQQHAVAAMLDELRNEFGDDRD